MPLSLPLLLALPPQPIPLPREAAAIIAEVAPDAHTAATLITIAAHESAYHPTALGDHGRSCGAFQTPCPITPPKDFHGQAIVALRILRTAARVCPAHPLYVYASGRCTPSRVARYYEREVERVESELARELEHPRAPARAH